MRAIILAGGKGTRLRPYTTLIPKPLVPIGGKYSILEVVLMQLADAGFSRVTLAVNHLANLIQAYFGNGDILCDLNYRKFFENHVASDADVSVSSFRRDVKIDFGVLE